MTKATLLVVIYWGTLLSSCTKTSDASVPVEPIKSLPINITSRPAVDKDLNWCGYNISCWGDSFTEAPGAKPYTAYIAAAIKGVKVFNGGVSGQSSTQIRNRFLVDSMHNKDAAVIWIGRNNFWSWSTVLNDIDTIIARLPHKKIVVLPILNGDWDNGDWGEWKQSTWNGGYSFYKHLNWFNDTLAAKYKNHFVDIRSYLMSKASKTAEDSLSVYHDVTPKSLRVDELHLNSLGTKYVAEEIMFRLSFICNNKK